MGVHGQTQEAPEPACLKRPRRPVIGDGTGNKPIPTRRDQGCDPKTGSRVNPARIKLVLAKMAMTCAGDISQSPPKSASHTPLSTLYSSCRQEYLLLRAFTQVFTTIPHYRHNECPIIGTQFENPCAKGRSFAGLDGSFFRQQVASGTAQCNRKPV